MSQVQTNRVAEIPEIVREVPKIVTQEVVRDVPQVQIIHRVASPRSYGGNSATETRETT